MNFHNEPPKPAHLCNEALDTPLTEVERNEMITAAAQKLEELFDILRIDHQNDHNTRETPQRVAKMFVEELLEGRYTAPPTITEFDNAQAYDQLIVTGPLELRSTCAHHLMPIYGEAYIGILPSADGKIIGLSQYIMDVTAPRGLAVRISAVHMCKTQRGVRASHRSRMVNTYYWGELASDTALKSEFLQECTSLDRLGSA